MSLTQILIFAALGLLYQPLARRRGRVWLLLAVSVLALYALQPASPVRHLDFWLPTASLGLAVLTWCATRMQEERDVAEPLRTFAGVAALVLLLTLTRDLGPAFRLTATRPPPFLAAVLALVILAVLSALALAARSRRALVGSAALFLIALFIILKSEPLATGASAFLRMQTGQRAELAAPLDLRWLGFSYIAFRLLHTLRDRLTGKLPSLTLREYLIYILFFPALAAGPIDRAERFAGDLRSPSPALTEGGARVAIGVFKKFVLADSLALLSLAPATVHQTSSPIWLWILLYAYAFRLYLDFSGYTDVAIGLGRLFGVRLPENFSRPYLRENLTAFWNSWHMTLAGWFRSYFFNPLTRALRSARRPVPAGLIVFLSTMSTMILIGLWHGITWNFAVWGAWHGAGLFIHNRWADLLKRRGIRLSPQGAGGRLAAIGGTILTFHFVTLGWAWFALPGLDLSWRLLLGLIGARP